MIRFMIIFIIMFRFLRRSWGRGCLSVGLLYPTASREHQSSWGRKRYEKFDYTPKLVNQIVPDLYYNFMQLTGGHTQAHH